VVVADSEVRSGPAPEQGQRQKCSATVRWSQAKQTACLAGRDAEVCLCSVALCARPGRASTFARACVSPFPERRCLCSRKRAG